MDDHRLKEIATQRVQMKRQFAIFVLVNIFLWVLWGIDCIRGGYQFPWPVYPTLIWGVIIAFQYFTKYAFTKKGDAVEREYEKLKKMDKDHK